jgi:hypothetical protein
MVDELNQQAIRIVKVEGSSAVAVGLGFLCERNAMTADPFRPLVDVFRPSHHETDMMNGLNASGFGARLKLMKGKVILS